MDPMHYLIAITLFVATLSLFVSIAAYLRREPKREEGNSPSYEEVNEALGARVTHNEVIEALQEERRYIQKHYPTKSWVKKWLHTKKAVNLALEKLEMKIQAKPDSKDIENWVMEYTRSFLHADAKHLIDANGTRLESQEQHIRALLKRVHELEEQLGKSENPPLPPQPPMVPQAGGNPLAHFPTVPMEPIIGKLDTIPIDQGQILEESDSQAYFGVPDSGEFAHLGPFTTVPIRETNHDLAALVRECVSGEF